MIFSQIPYRISLFGGGTDFPEWFNNNDSMVISTAINKYATIGIRYLPGFFNHKYRIVYSKIDLVNKISQISHPVVRTGLDYYGVKQGIELCHYGDLPARSGIGSSSSFTVGFVYLINKLKNKDISKNQIAKEAIKLEREIMGESGGWQDQIIASYGGFKFINFKKKRFEVRNINIKQKNIKKLSNSLLMFYSGDVRNSYIIQENLKKKIPKLNYELNLLCDLSQEAKKIILSEKNYDDLGKLLDETWQIKKKLNQSVSNNKIDEIYKLAIKSGAIGGKLIGAGLAGFLIFYCPINKQKKLIKSLNKLIHIPFEFEPEGVKSI
jgi:D-glycero-alpha-D-manno-heptose-7-phosphate kinase